MERGDYILIDRYTSIYQNGLTNPSPARTSDPLINSHEHLKYCFSREYTENIGLMELHVIPNVCSEYSEQKIQANGRPYRTIIHST